MRFLLLNQFFYPDVASTAQHAADLAGELARQGHQVTVLAGRRAYDDPRVSLPAGQWWEGIRIRRVWHTGFGKRARWRRAADFASFCAASAWRLLWWPRFDVVVAMTTPPLISFLAACFVRLKGGRLCLWMMDLNPDQAVAAGWLRAGSAAYRMLARALRFSVNTAGRVVVLDRFMAARLNNGTNTVILPPWTHDGAVRFDPEGRERFRREHCLDGRFVVMYSGNHSPCHPLDTLLEAARNINHRDTEDTEKIVFVFVGGGSEFGKVRRCGLRNVVCLPYQPREQLSASLSAADLHVVVMGDPYVGIVHPCKIYNILRLGIPVLYIGPAESHITDMLPPQALGDWAHLFRHGDAGAVASCIAECARAGMRRSPEAMRLAEAFSQNLLWPRMAALINGSMNQCLNVPMTQCLNGPMTR